MFNTKNTNINKNSKLNINIIYVLLFSCIEYQLDINTIGVINVINIIKYKDIPSTPKYKSNPLISLIFSIY